MCTDDDRGGVPGTQWGVWNLTKKWWATWTPFDTRAEAIVWLFQYRLSQKFLLEPQRNWRYEVRPFPAQEPKP